MLLDGERPEMSGVPSGVLWHQDVVAGKEQAAEPFSRTHDDNADYRKQGDGRKVRECRWNNPEHAPGVEAAKTYPAGSFILVEQAAADQQPADTKEQVNSKYAVLAD